MKRFLATTALVLVMAGGTAYAAGPLTTYQYQPNDVKASQFIGQRIYATDNMPTTDMVAAGAEKDWDDIGEINEVILGRDGAVKAVVLGVGGFLGMGEKDVAVPMSDVKFVRNGDGQDDYFLVVNTSKQALTDAPAYVEPVPTADAGDAVTTPPMDNAATPLDTASNNAATPAEPMTDNAASAPDTQTTSSTTTPMATDDAARTRLVRPEITREGYSAIQATEIPADKLTGAIVYGPKDENVGEVNRVILSEDGKVDRVVLDIGGFLGVGEKQIAVTMDELNIVKNAAGDDFRVYIDSNTANLKAQPDFKG